MRISASVHARASVGGGETCLTLALNAAMLGCNNELVWWDVTSYEGACEAVEADGGVQRGYHLVITWSSPIEPTLVNLPRGGGSYCTPLQRPSTLLRQSTSSPAISLSPPPPRSKPPKRHSLPSIQLPLPHPGHELTDCSTFSRAREKVEP